VIFSGQHNGPDGTFIAKRVLWRIWTRNHLLSCKAIPSRSLDALS